MTINEMSLFDVEDLEEMPKVRDMTVGPVSNGDMREFARRYHYTGLPGSSAWRWGPGMATTATTGWVTPGSGQAANQSDQTFPCATLSAQRGHHERT